MVFFAERAFRFSAHSQSHSHFLSTSKRTSLKKERKASDFQIEMMTTFVHDFSPCRIQYWNSVSLLCCVGCDIHIFIYIINVMLLQLECAMFFEPSLCYHFFFLYFYHCFIISSTGKSRSSSCLVFLLEFLFLASHLYSCALAKFSSWAIFFRFLFFSFRSFAISFCRSFIFRLASSSSSSSYFSWAVFFISVGRFDEPLFHHANAFRG